MPPSSNGNPTTRLPGEVAGELLCCQHDTIEYRSAVELQQRLRAARIERRIPDVLVLLDHPPVYTLGRRADPSELPMGEDWYRSQGIDVVDTDRGGKLTYHGPGQLVGYPIMRIDDVVDYLRTMEAAIIGALADAGVEARLRPGLTGVWVQDRKIASIGVHVSRGVTTHGFAVNVVNDLQPFEWIVPCGLAGVRMTSVGAETGRYDLNRFRWQMGLRFAETFGRVQRSITAEGLLDMTADRDAAITL